MQTVGIYIAELDRLEAEIADIYLRLNPEKAEAKCKAEAAHERAAKSEEEFRTSKPIDPDHQRFRPSSNIKSIYRSICKKIHPDLTVDPAEKLRRTELMAEVNRAFENGDEEILKEIFEDIEVNNLEGADSYQAEINLLHRKIEQAQNRIGQIDIKIYKLTYSDLFGLMKKVNNSENEGIDLLDSMAKNIQAKIDERKQTLEILRVNLGEMDNN